MALLSDPIKSLEFLRKFGLDVSMECLNQLEDMGYKLPERDRETNGKNKGGKNEIYKR